MSYEEEDTCVCVVGSWLTSWFATNFSELPIQLQRAPHSIIVEESIQSAESAGPSWIMLRVLIPHLGSAQGRPAHAGKDGGPASPFKWRALASRAAGVDVGGGGEGRGCFVWVRGNASVEELCALLETHTRIPRSRLHPTRVSINR